MNSAISVGKYILVGIAVIAIGALAGWFFVLRTKTDATNAADDARGFGATAPFASSNGSTYQNGASTINAIGSVNTADDILQVPRLWHVEKTPVAGFGFGSTSVLYFASRTSGYVFQADLNSGQVTRLSNTLMPKTYQAYFDKNGSVILRSVNDNGAVETFSGRIEASNDSAIGKLTGTNLDNNIRDLAVDRDASALFYLMQGTADATIGINSKWKGDGETRIFSSPLGGWKPIALSDGRKFIVQKAADGAPGYAYEIPKSGPMKAVVRAAPGLTFLPQSGTNAVLFGTSDAALSLYLKTSPTDSAVQLPIRTIADKCAWAPAPSRERSASTTWAAYCGVPDSAPSNFLAEWYQGGIHPSDALWRIDASTGKASQMLLAHESGSDIDIIDPVVDPTGTYIAFGNAADGSLWVYRIK